MQSANAAHGPVDMTLDGAFLNVNVDAKNRTALEGYQLSIGQSNDILQVGTDRCALAFCSVVLWPGSDGAQVDGNGKKVDEQVIEEIKDLVRGQAPNLVLQFNVQRSSEPAKVRTHDQVAQSVGIHPECVVRRHGQRSEGAQGCARYSCRGSNHKGGFGL